MAATEEFAHGRHYGDFSGIIFHGSGAGAAPPDRLAVSDLYAAPLFLALLERERPPRVASDWDTLTGWASADGPFPIPAADAAEFAEALASLGPADLAGRCDGPTPDECLHCAGVVREFITDYLSRGAGVLLEAH